MLNFNLPVRSVARFIGYFAVAILLTSTLLSAQSTVGTGSIEGTVSDQTGFVVSGAKVTVTNRATAGAITLTTSSAGAYSTGPIQPGDYTVRVEAKGFKTLNLTVTVQVGNVTGGNVQMQVGQESQVIEVQAAAVTVNTEQATVQGVLTASQIDDLPVNGRNFLDLPNWSRAFRFRRAALSTRPRMGSPRSPSAADSGARRALKWMVLMSATRQSVRPLKIFPPAPFRNFSFRNPHSTCPRS